MLNQIVKNLLGELGKMSKSHSVAGQVRDAGKAKVLPLCKVSIGFGTGGGDVGGKHDGENASRNAGLEGGAAAGALVVEPRAFVVVGEDGVPHMVALHGGRKAVVRRAIDVVTGNGTKGALPGPNQR